jgi:hypothetical protein
MAPSRTSETEFKYIWELRFKAVLAETDARLLLGLIKKTRDTMAKRLGVLAIHEHPSALAEYLAIQDADLQLRALEQQGK